MTTPTSNILETESRASWQRMPLFLDSQAWIMHLHRVRLGFFTALAFFSAAQSSEPESRIQVRGIQMQLQGAITYGSCALSLLQSRRKPLKREVGLPPLSSPCSTSTSTVHACVCVIPLHPDIPWMQTPAHPDFGRRSKTIKGISECRGTRGVQLPVRRWAL